MHSSKSSFKNWSLASALLGGIIEACCCWPAAAQSFPVDPTLPLATGAFIQVNGSLASQSPMWWQAELGAMKTVGMDTVVVNYVAYDNFYFYPTSVSGGQPFVIDSIENIMDAADHHGMSVFLGLHLEPEQFSSATFNLPANLAQGQAELTELWSRYGSHASLAGWYMPQEFSDYMALYQPQLRDDIISYTRAVTDQADVSTGLPMMISPYFGQNPNAAAYANWWSTTGLPETGVDIVAMQDGVGTHRTTIAQSRTVFEALQPVMAAHGVQFWANNESFNQIHGWPVDNQPWAAQPVGIDTFVAQIQSTNSLVQKSITFEFSHYMSPQGSAAMNALYRDYRDYYESVVSGVERIEIASYVYDNPPTTWVHNLAPDPSRTLLTDGNTGSLSGGAGGSFANGTWVGFGSADSPTGGPHPRVVFDLGGQHWVDSVELFYLVAASPSIYAPQPVPGVADAVVVETSADGSNFTQAAASSDFVPWTTDRANNAFEIRSVVLDLGGAAASHIAVNVHSPNTWIFLSELLVFAGNAPADFDDDGEVDGSDLLLWTSHFGDAGAVGDADRDGDVDGGDFLLWQRQLGFQRAVTTRQPVPEPRAGTLVLACSVWMALSRAASICRGTVGTER